LASEEEEMSENAITVLKKYGRSPEIIERFAEVVGKHGAYSYVSSVLLAVSTNDKLQLCTPQSIFSQAMRAATLRLSCDPGIGDAYLVPFGRQATLIIGYKGLYRMAVRTGRYRYINVGRVYEGEELEEDRLSGFMKIGGKRKSNTVIGHIAAFELVDGYGKVIYMSIEEIHELAKRFSKSYNKPDSPWKTNTEDMEKKTVLRRLISKWGYFDPSDAMMMSESQPDEIDGDFVDMPDPDDIPDPPPPTPHTEEELIAMLSGDSPKVKIGGVEVTPKVSDISHSSKPPNPTNVIQPELDGSNGKMALETALAVQNSEGITYGELDDETLGHMANTMRDVLAGKKKTSKYTPEDLKFKVDAIDVILAHRSAG